MQSRIFVKKGKYPSSYLNLRIPTSIIYMPSPRAVINSRKVIKWRSCCLQQARTGNNFTAVQRESHSLQSRMEHARGAQLNISSKHSSPLSTQTYSRDTTKIWLWHTRHMFLQYCPHICGMSTDTSISSRSSRRTWCPCRATCSRCEIFLCGSQADNLCICSIYLSKHNSISGLFHIDTQLHKSTMYYYSCVSGLGCSPTDISNNVTVLRRQLRRKSSYGHKQSDCSLMLSVRVHWNLYISEDDDDQ
jgi:hypothetical protein